MRGLSQTVAGLARRRETMTPPSDGGADAGLVEVRGFGFNPGGLRMLAYVPERLASKAPMVVVLHGCTQRAGAYARAAGWLALADRLRFAVLAPEQTCENNPNRCFNWFEPGDTVRGAGEAASIHAMVEHMVRTHHIDAERVFITGLSAGGAMTSVLLATYPETFAAGAVVAGLPFGVAGNVHEAFAVMRRGVDLGGPQLGALVDAAAPAPRRRPRLTIWHGEADGTVVSGNAEALAQQWAASHRLPEEPTQVLARPRWTRSVWRGSAGEVLVELNLLAGLGHGTPLAAAGDDPIGEVGPFMLEAGVSSSLDIARFWDLAPQAMAAHAEDWVAADTPCRQRPSSVNGLGESVLASVSPHVPDPIRDLIAKALAAAGLMS
jgi:poly(hydroxyalkanoate) depolymerase family esterase